MIMQPLLHGNPPDRSDVPSVLNAVTTIHEVKVNNCGELTGDGLGKPHSRWDRGPYRGLSGSTINSPTINQPALNSRLSTLNSQPSTINAFTLIELLVIIAVTSAVAITLLPALAKSNPNTKA